MAQITTLPRSHAAPAVQGLRLPLKAITAIAFVLGFVALSAVLPAGDVAPDMAWRGNSGSLHLVR